MQISEGTLVSTSGIKECKNVLETTHNLQHISKCYIMFDSTLCW